MIAIAIVSGGMDSVTLAHYLDAEGYAVHILAFDYGQRHRKELEFSAACAQRLDAPFDLIDLSSVGRHLTGSSLTDTIAVPDGHYAEESMRITVVPNRNAIMLAVAYGVAVARGATVVAAAVHAGDHYIYPDCRQGFVDAFSSMQLLAVEGFGHPDLALLAPFVGIGKHDIVTIGANLHVPYEETWSCYKGGDVHCGTCGTCVERKEAFALAGVVDPTVYLGGTIGTPTKH
jgi:7-cyano-7-deazaguanine synthase